MSNSPPLTETIASTATIKLAQLPESTYFCTPIEERFERITRLARRALDVPVAAITFLSTLVPGFTDPLKYAVVAGAVAGGGLTIIANAPNPAGVSILKKYFNDEVSPAGILAGALVPTAVMILLFLLL